jgi:large subunit ribosomal protein L6
MSRVAKAPVLLPKGVTAEVKDGCLTVRGQKGQLKLDLNSCVSVEIGEDRMVFSPNSNMADAWAQAGTARAISNNMVKGVSSGFSKKLELVGVGYRAAAKGRTLSLTLGFSHPVEYELPEGVTVETPTQTEILLSGADKHLLGQTAAKIRSYRPPEPYKGKGVRYSDETVLRKEAKKK